jgi:D-xylose transport system substrate-binding protein
MKKIIIFFLLSIITIINVQKIKCQSDDSLQVGFILANLFYERWWNDKAYFEERFNELGGKVIFEDCYDMTDNQIKAAKQFIQQGVDCIVIVPVDAENTKTVVDLAHEANIPVVAYDRLILHAPVDLYCTVNSITVGELMAKSVREVLDKGLILYLDGPKEDFNCHFIKEGTFNVLDTITGDFTIDTTCTSSWNQLDAYLVLQNYIATKGLIPDAIICAADMLTYGAISVLTENDKLGKVFITGQDAELEICRHVVQGNVLMTVYKSNKELAYAAAVATWKLINKEEFKVDGYINNYLIEVPSILIPPILINKQTLNEALIKGGIYSKDEIYK